MSQAKLLNYPTAQNPSISPRQQRNNAHQPIEEAVQPRSCCANLSDHPYDVVSSAQASLAFVQASFANKWDVVLTEEMLSGLFFILSDINNSLQYAKELISGKKE